MRGTRPWESYPVTVAAVLKRINRVLTKDSRQLRKNRRSPHGALQVSDSGEWLQIDLYHNRLIGSTDDLEGFARELGVLAAWESVPD